MMQHLDININIQIDLMKCQIQENQAAPNKKKWFPKASYLSSEHDNQCLRKSKPINYSLFNIYMFTIVKMFHYREGKKIYIQR